MGVQSVGRLMILWLLREQSYERNMKGETKMQEEQQQNQQNQPLETSPTEEPVKEEAPPELKAPEGEHDVVSPGMACSKCNWKWGDPEPHVVTFAVGNEPPKPQQKATDPNTCPPVAYAGTCPKCGWSVNDPKLGMNPHSVY